MIKTILITGIIIICLYSTDFVNYTVKTRVLLHQLKKEFGERCVVQFLNSKSYSMAHSPKEVYLLLVAHIKTLKSHGEHKC